MMKMKTMKEEEIGETQKNENNRWEIDILKKKKNLEEWIQNIEKPTKPM